MFCLAWCYCIFVSVCYLVVLDLGGRNWLLLILFETWLLFACGISLFCGALLASGFWWCFDSCLLILFVYLFIVVDVVLCVCCLLCMYEFMIWLIVL